MIAKLGRWCNRKVRSGLYAAGYCFHVFRDMLGFFTRRQIGYKVMSLQILFTGVEALGVIALLSMGLGAVIIIQGLTQLPQFGQGNLIYSILLIVITRELGPILTAFIVTARSGTAIATELGNMVVQHEIEAYISVGINPITYLVVPRVLGVTISLVFLNLYFNFFGLIGSYFVTQFVVPVPIDEYFSNLLLTLKTSDIASSLIKSCIFGIIISMVATFNGLKVQQSSTEIPVAVIKAVGQGVVYCILANAVITLLYYL